MRGSDLSSRSGSHPFPLLREYERSATEGLILGSSVTVPAACVGAVLSRRGQLTDLLPAGTHLVQPDGLPGLAAATRMKPTVGTRVPAAIYLLDTRPVRDLPWSVELDATGNRPGRMLARLEGRLGLQVADSRRFLTHWLAGAIRHARSQKAGQAQSFRLSTGAGAEKTALERLPDLAGLLLEDSIGRIVGQELARLQIPVDSLPSWQSQIRAAAEPAAAAWAAGVGLQLQQFELSPVRPPVRAPCARCGSDVAPTGFGTFRRNIRLLHVRFTQRVDGNFCVPCAAATALGYNAVMLVCGWWGIIGLFLSPFWFLANLWNLARVMIGPRESVQAAGGAVPV